MCLTDVIGIFAGIVIYISSIFNRSRSAVRQPSDFSPAMDGQKTILQDGALLSATHPLRKITKPLSSPLEVSEDFFGEADAEKQRSFRGCFGRKNLLNTCRIFGGIIDGGFVKGNLRMEKVKVGFLTIRPILGSILLSFERF